MTLPNILTFIRLIIAPVFLALFSYCEEIGLPRNSALYLLLFLMTLAELTDAFDGFIARKFHQISDLGKILDPMADSICHIAYFLAFTQNPVAVPLFLVFIFIYRDAVISTLRTVCALQGVALAARKSGKFKSIFQAFTSFTILFLLIAYTKGIYLKKYYRLQVRF